MSAISPGEVQELDLTTDALQETKHLQKNFGRKEILFFTICTLVGVDTIGLLASLGAEAFTWNVILALTFFIPSALLFAELGTAFPQEGGPYIWARLAFGRLAATVNNVLYWVTNPVWFGGTLAIGGKDLAATQAWERSREARVLYARSPVLDAYQMSAPKLDGKLNELVVLENRHADFALRGADQDLSLHHGPQRNPEAATQHDRPRTRGKAKVYGRAAGQRRSGRRPSDWSATLHGWSGPSCRG